MLQKELKNANDHIEFISRMSNMEVKKFGVQSFHHQLENATTPKDIRETLKVSIAQEEVPYKNNKREDGEMYNSSPESSPKKKKETQLRFEYDGVSLPLFE